MDDYARVVERRSPLPELIRLESNPSPAGGFEAFQRAQLRMIASAFSPSFERVSKNLTLAERSVLRSRALDAFRK
jgi:capsid protein